MASHSYKLDLIRQNRLLVGAIFTIQNNQEILQLAKDLRGNHLLRVLTLNFSSLQGAVTTESSDALSSAITLTKLDELIIVRSPPPKSLNHFLSRQLLQAVTKSPTIHSLSLLNGVGDMPTLMDCLPKLRKFCFSRSLSQPENLKPLMQRLRFASNLTTLCLQETQLRKKELQLLAKGLADNLSVTELVVDNCGVNDAGVAGFVQHWHPNSSIRRMKWTANKITGIGANLLIQAASNRAAMESLDLERNQDIGYQGLVKIASELPRIALKELSLQSCVRRSSKLERRFEQMRALILLLVLEGMNSNLHLVALDVTANGLDIVPESFQRKFQLYMYRNRHTPMVLVLKSPAKPSATQSSPRRWCKIFAKCKYFPTFILEFLAELAMRWRDATGGYDCARPQKKSRK